MSQSSDQTTERVPSCPKCDRPMMRRTARRGANAGREFWGCTEFPRCRGIVQDEAPVDAPAEKDASAPQQRTPDKAEEAAEEAADSDAAGKSGGFLTKVAKAVDKGYRWHLESDEPDAGGRWDKDHRRRMRGEVCRLCRTRVLCWP